MTCTKKWPSLATNSILLLLLVYSNCAIGMMNLFLDSTETYRLLGMQAELFYIRGGVIQAKALGHVFKVPHDMNEAHFTWESLTQYPVNYTIDVEISNKKLIQSVTLNVSGKGVIPPSRETVMILFICSGTQNAQVVVDFNFEFFIPEFPVNTTRITFKREKFCTKDIQNVYDVDQQALSEDSNSSQLKVFYIVLCFGCSMFTLLTLCFLAYIVSNKKDRQDPLQTEQQVRLRPSETENVPYILSASAINSGTSTSSNMSHTSTKKRQNYSQLDNRSLDLQDRISEITIQRKRIRLQKIELEGTFGRVFVGTYSKEDGSEEEVIVKTVMDFASSNQISLLLREGLTMYGLKHKNIMSVLGVSIEDHVEPFVIYLREGFTNLKKYLQKCKLCQEGITHILTTQEVVEIALQIICGIQYMHKKKLLHKDLAARNCFILVRFMCDYRKLILKPSTKAHPRNDLLLSSLRRKIRFRPPFGGRLSNNAVPFFFNGRKNSGRTAFNELLRERYRQIDLDQRNAAEKARTVEEKLQGDVSAHRIKVVSPAVHKNVLDFNVPKRKPRMQALPKRSVGVPTAGGAVTKTARSPGKKSVSKSTPTRETKGLLVSPAPSKTTSKDAVKNGKSTMAFTEASPAGVKRAKGLTTTQGKSAATITTKGTPPQGVKGEKSTTKGAPTEGVKGTKSTTAGATKGIPPQGVKGASTRGVKEAKAPASATTEGKPSASAIPSQGVKGAKAPATVTTQNVKGAKAPPSGVKEAKALPSGVKRVKAPSSIAPSQITSPGVEAIATLTPSSTAGVPGTKTVDAKIPISRKSDPSPPIGARSAPATPSGVKSSVPTETLRRSSVTTQRYGSTIRERAKKLPESAATGDTKAPSIKGSPTTLTRSPSASLRTEPSPQIAAGESSEFPVSPASKRDSPTESLAPIPDLSAAPGGDMKLITTPFAVTKKYTTAQPPASDADGLTTTTRIPPCTPCFSWMSATKQQRGPFSRPLTFGTPTPVHGLSEEEQINYEKREQEVRRAWGLTIHRLSRTVPFPMRKPTYIRRPPILAYEQTRTYELRRDLTSKRKDEPKHELTSSKKARKFIEPKRNLTQNLRYKQFKKEPIFSEFFDKCYNKIDAALNVKVADNALSRDLFPNDYHCLGDNENRPVKWLAIESLVHRTFSTASDVWSFGVTLWELTTLGQQPYVEVDPFEVEHYLKDGFRLSQPVNCPDELFAVMAYCWAMSPDERPTFSQLLTCLQDFRNQLNRYV